MTVNVRVGIAAGTREVLRRFGSLATDQLPFAASRALNQTATEARDAVRAGLPKRFELRSKTLPGTIQATSSTKREWPNLRATVGALAQVLVRQEAGGTKLPLRRYLAIPTAVVKAKRTGTGRVPKSLRPAVLLQKRNVSLTDDHRIVRRRARGAAPETLYLLRPRARIKPVLGMETTVRDVAARRFPALLVEAMDLALQTRRR